MQFWTEKKMLWGMIALYLLLFGITASARHYHFQTQSGDLGIFVQIFWNAVHGRGFVGTLEEMPNHFGIHMSPFFYLLLPFYFLVASPYALLCLQTIALGIGAWPLFLLAKRMLGGRWALLIAAGYLLHPSVHWINLFDFHEIAFFIPLFLAALYFLETEQWKWSGLFLALAASTKEDATIIIFFVGLYLFFKPSLASTWPNTTKKMGILVMALSIAYFFITITVVMPRFGDVLLRIDRYSQLGATAPEIIKTVFTQPQLVLRTIFTSEKVRYLFWLLAPVAFLPLVSGRALILLVPGLAENLLTHYKSQFSGLYHYDATIVPALFIATIYGIQRLRSVPQKRLIWIFIAVITFGYLFRSPFNPINFPTHFFQSNPKWDAYRTMIQRVPPEASVAAHTNLVPHLAERKNIFMLGTETLSPDYLLIDATDAFGFKDENLFNDYFDRYANSGAYEIEVIEGQYVILKKK